MTAFAEGLIDRADRCLLLMVSSGGMAICLFLVGAAFYVKAYIISFSLGIGFIPWIIMSEILPVNVKGLAGSVATLENWSSSWLVIFLALYFYTWGMS